MREKLLGLSYIGVIISFFLYSFTQVDLGLAFSKSVVLQNVLFSFQKIGYFQRPLSTTIYLIFLLFLFGFYLYFLLLVIKGRLKTKFIWTIIIFTTIILAFSYNAFSYDFFNYIFDAKIFTFYHQNPYLHKALDYSADPMLGFMHWTHRVYPYGPLWLGLTIPLSFLGMHVFWLTFIIFKFFTSLCYVGSAYLLYKINQKILPKYSDFNLVLFALNPLVIIESLVSSHNDIVMLFFALLGLNLFFSSKKILSVFFVVLSAAVKIPTVFLLLPIMLSFLPIKKKLNNNNFVWALIFFSSAGLLAALTRLEIQPWYVLWVFPFICMLTPNRYIVAGSTGLTLGLLLRYAPFLYYGNWNGGVPSIELAVTILSPSLFIFLVFILRKISYAKNN